jgi:hypothetical protein
VSPPPEASEFEVFLAIVTAFTFVGACELRNSPPPWWAALLSVTVSLVSPSTPLLKMPPPKPFGVLFESIVELLMPIDEPTWLKRPPPFPTTA